MIDHELVIKKDEFLNIVKLEMDTFRYVTDKLQDILEGKKPEAGGASKEEIMLNKAYTAFSLGAFKKADKLF